MKISLKNYTLKYLTIAFLIVLAVWASLFYAYILDEVYDNVDDGLKDRKNEIIQQTLQHPEYLNIREFGIEEFRFYPSDSQVSVKNKVYNEHYYMPYDDEDEPYRVLRTGFTSPQGQPFVLEIRTSTVEEDDLLLSLAIALGVLYFVLVFTTYLINSLLINKIWSPFNHIINNIKNYQLNNKDLIQPIKTNVIEFNKLHKNIEQMWARNEDIFEEQKIFIENAAHELQTPLAIAINKLELLLEDEQLSEKQLVTLSETKSVLTRMTNLNKSLLMLSRIENNQYKQSELVSFNEIFKNLTEDFKDLTDFRKISLTFIEKNSFQTHMNKDLATILASNFLRNAIKHNQQGGNIEIITQKNSFSIKNTGKNIPLNKKMIFKRFYKGEQDSTSTGLGLSIIKSIVELYPHLSLEYDFIDNQHTFEVKQV